MDIQISVSGEDNATELASLWKWLQDEDELRGDVSPVESLIGKTELGGAVELITVVVGSGSAAVLARSLSTWLQTRRSDIKVTMTSEDRIIELEAKRVQDALPLLKEVLRDHEIS